MSENISLKIDVNVAVSQYEKESMLGIVYN